MKFQLPKGLTNLFNFDLTNMHVKDTHISYETQRVLIISLSDKIQELKQQLKKNDMTIASLQEQSEEATKEASELHALLIAGRRDLAEVCKLSADRLADLNQMHQSRELWRFLALGQFCLSILAVIMYFVGVYYGVQL